jgi:group II intron reverse transcriptase/maturase
MSLVGAGHQKSVQMELPFDGRGEAPSDGRSGEASTAAKGDERSGWDHLLEEVILRQNVREALRRVKANKGSPGVDGMTVDELPAYLNANWGALRGQLLDGTYQPQPVRRQEIPKAGGGVRKLGIPTVLDRLIQQAMLQVLGPRFDATFSEHSYGFRPGRRAHDAVCVAQRQVQEGRQWVVDIDLEQFFDRVNHDVLMGKLSKRIADRRLLGLIRRFLEAGILADGISMERHEGTPQGGPLSPLLANVLLDEVDRDLERRGHAFVRYADDCNVYVRSQRAGERVLQSLRRLYARLRLRINEAKSAVARPWDREFLGYSFWVAKDGAIKLRIADKALNAMKERIRQTTSRTRGRTLESMIAELRDYLPGWRQYFRLEETPQGLLRLDQWIRRRLRMVQLKQWKRGPRIFEALCARGAPRNAAASAAAHARRWWRISRHPALNIALPPALFDRKGLPRLKT